MNPEIENPQIREKLAEILSFLYGAEDAPQIELQSLLAKWRRKFESISAQPETPSTKLPEKPSTKLPLDQSHVVLITYGDSIHSADGSPLQTLKQFADRYLCESISTIHLLPCFPYSSDDGFSVIDYRQIDPALGDWGDIERLREHFCMMYDLVLNHCSQHSEWFRSFLAGRAPGFFCTGDPADERLKQVFRPRSLPLLHEFDCTDSEGEPNGEKIWVWTTFSRDQVDLNFANPKVLLEYCDILLEYAYRGAQIVRLDAIGFLWKELGTSCMHHPKTHAVVQLLRCVLSAVAPRSVLLTETNVPHEQNISYFGNGQNEAQMVYQFSLPPLVLHSFLQGDARHLTAWAQQLPQPNPDTTFFNFLASHDGIGLLGARGYLNAAEQESLIAKILARGGQVGYKDTPDGPIPYELNINYLDAIAEAELPASVRAAKFLAAYSIVIGMAGVPGIYIHSMVGSGNWLEGVEQSGIKRRINREKLDIDELCAELEREGSLRSRIYSGMRNMLRVRRAHSAFDPAAGQHILQLKPEIFAFERYTPKERVYCLVNCSAAPCAVGGFAAGFVAMGRDLLSGQNMAQVLEMQPYQVLWLAQTQNERENGQRG